MKNPRMSFRRRWITLLSADLNFFIQPCYVSCLFLFFCTNQDDKPLLDASIARLEEEILEKNAAALRSIDCSPAGKGDQLSRSDSARKVVFQKGGVFAAHADAVAIKQEKVRAVEEDPWLSKAFVQGDHSMRFATTCRFLSNWNIAEVTWLQIIEFAGIWHP